MEAEVARDAAPRGAGGGFERLGHGEMQRAALRRKQPLEQGVAGERMAEGDDRRGVVPDFDHDVAVDELP